MWLPQACYTQEGGLLTQAVRESQGSSVEWMTPELNPEGQESA